MAERAAMNQKDEDSDNDSDYIPDESKGIEGTQTSKRENVANEITEEINSKRRKRKIDSIWEELQSEERNFAEDKRSRANFDKGRRKATICSDANSILADIFGKSKARELTGSKKQTKVSQRRATASDAIEIKERARVAANKVMSETKEVVEVHKFAGERMK